MECSKEHMQHIAKVVVIRNNRRARGLINDNKKQRTGMF